MNEVKNVFIVGCKGIPAQYGGYETFVENLTLYNNNPNLKYHVACIGNNDVDEFEHNNARCFCVKVPNIGPAKAILYDIKAIKKSIRYIRDNKIEKAVIYVLACRIGPFVLPLKKEMKKYGIKLLINPDGHEWLRAKWSKPVKKYWKYSEKYMVKNADLVVCDSKNIEKYIKEEYGKFNPKTTYIAYGADITKSCLKEKDKTIEEWYRVHELKKGNYYLVVGRFVPENNLETIIKEYMNSNTKRNLAIVTNVENNSFYDKLKKETNFEKDPRIKFVGTVYEKELIKKIRENAYGYIHGHSVGGTNPSLIEALATTSINLLYDVGFNREVAEDSALYWKLDLGSLCGLINMCDGLSNGEIEKYAKLAKEKVNNSYTWEIIVKKYDDLWKAI